ncbi:rod-binding protein [Candidatus Riflebacteria bacterium]
METAVNYLKSRLDPVFLAEQNYLKLQEKNNIKKKTLTSREKKTLTEAAMNFEAIFVQEIFKAMEKTKLKTGWINGGQGEEMFQEMLLYERAKNATHSFNFGLANTLYYQLTGEKMAGDMKNQRNNNSLKILKKGLEKI